MAKSAKSKPSPKKPAPAPRSAREAAVEGEKPSDTIVRFFRQIHRQTGMPLRPADEADLKRACARLDGKPDSGTPVGSAGPGAAPVGAGDAQGG